jgi:hypothetical protein
VEALFGDAVGASAGNSKKRGVVVSIRETADISITLCPSMPMGHCSPPVPSSRAVPPQTSVTQGISKIVQPPLLRSLSSISGNNVVYRVDPTRKVWLFLAICRTMPPAQPYSMGFNSSSDDTHPSCWSLPHAGTTSEAEPAAIIRLPRGHKELRQFI